MGKTKSLIVTIILFSLGIITFVCLLYVLQQAKDDTDTNSFQQTIIRSGIINYYKKNVNENGYTEYSFSFDGDSNTYVGTNYYLSNDEAEDCSIGDSVVIMLTDNDLDRVYDKEFDPIISFLNFKDQEFY